MVEHVFGVEIYYKQSFCGQITFEAEISEDDERDIVENMGNRAYLQPYSLSSNLYETLEDKIRESEEQRFQKKQFPYSVGTEFANYSFKIYV